MIEYKTFSRLILFICMFSIIPGGLSAAPVNLPANSGGRSPQIEVFKFSDASSRGLDSISGGVGLEIDYTGRRGLGADYSGKIEMSDTSLTTANTSAGGLNPLLEARFYSVELLLSFFNRIDLYTNLGLVSNLKYKPDSGSKAGLEFTDAFSYGGGLNVVLLELGRDLQLFGDARYREISELEPEKAYWLTGTNIYSSATNLVEESKYREYQIALGLSKGFEFDAGHKMFLYGGAKYSQIDFTAKGSAFTESNTLIYDIGPYESDQTIGGFAGVSYIIFPAGNSKIRCGFDFQARFIDELGGSLDFKVRF